MSEGWIKLHRKLLKSDMYQNLTSKQRDILITLLLMANHEPKKWEWNGQIFEVDRGQMITSLESIKKNCAKDVSVQSIRTALLKLEKWGFLTNESTKTGRLITIINYDTYQSTDTNTNKDINRQLTKHQQRANKELTTNKNDKNDKNDKNEKNIYLSLAGNESEIYSLFEKAMGHTISGFHFGALNGWIEKHGVDAVYVALQSVVDKKPERPFHYLRAILEERERRMNQPEPPNESPQDRIIRLTKEAIEEMEKENGRKKQTV